jgi:uncharacterized protein (DUF1501 family)
MLAPSVALPDARQMALAPELAPIKPLFDAGQMAVLLNVGTLIQPTTLAEYNAKSVPLPPKLFSHNDQQSVWQSSLPEGSTSGWGGRIGDLFLSGNGNATFTCVNVSGVLPASAAVSATSASSARAITRVCSACIRCVRGAVTSARSAALQLVLPKSGCCTPRSATLPPGDTWYCTALWPLM